VLALFALSSKPERAEAMAEAQAWIAALCGDGTTVADVRKHTAFPFIQKDFGPVDSARARECDDIIKSDDPAAFNVLGQCMLETDIANPFTIRKSFAHMKVVRPRPGRWREPFKAAVATRLKEHTFVQTTWETGCSVYTLTLAVRRTADGPAVSLALLDVDVVCE
jgi:hypothetical protein